jgi:hypothetical protein
MKPLVTGNLEVAAVLIGYMITCLTVMGIVFHKEWKTRKTHTPHHTMPEESL